jgi:ankyrin repeat protein
MLLGAGAEVDSKNKIGRTPLSWAAENGHKPIVALLLNRGADLNFKDIDHGQSPISWAVLKGHADVVDLLI